MSKLGKIKVLYLSGYTDYVAAWKYQRSLSEFLHQSRKVENRSICGYILLLQHKSVYTLGKGGDVRNYLQKGGGRVDETKYRPSDVITPPLYRVERGGDITWHGPGQLTVYPIIDLTNFKKDLHWYF